MVGINNHQTAHTKSRKLYYGWIVAIAGALILFLNAQFIYSFGVFLPPLTERFGWSRAAISSIASIRALVTAILSPVAGNLSDKYSTRKLMLAGIVLCGLGYMLAWRATSLWQFYLSFGLIIGISNGILVAPTMALVNKWFRGKSTLANGISMAGISVAQIIVPPAVTFLLGSYGWETTVVLIGGVVWVVGMLAWSLIKNAPQAEPQPLQSEVAGAVKPREAAFRDFTLSETMRTTGFWFLFFMYFLNAVCFQMVSVHVIAAAMDTGASAAAAAAVLTAMGITNTVGRLVAGVADRIGMRITLIITTAAQTIVLYALAKADSVQSFYVIIAIYGIVYGATLPNIQSLAASTFGTKAVGSILGILLMGYLVGGAVGPLVGGYVFDITGSYFGAFVIAAIALAICFLLTLTFKMPARLPER